MTFSWDPHPFPVRLDDRERHTFYGVGLVMSHWESVEFELGRLYSFFIDDPDGESIQTGYGIEQIFRERLASVRREACNFFIRWPNQDVEGLFDRLTERAEDLSGDRNNVAHGIVFDVSNITIFKMRFPESYGKSPQYALIPPLYTIRRHSKGIPDYAYALPELRALAAEIRDLLYDIREFREALAGLLAEWQAKRN